MSIAPTTLEGGLEVDGTDDPVFGGVDRQLDDAHPAARPRERFASLDSLATIGAERFLRIGITPIDAIGDDGELRQKPGQRADRSRLPGSLLATDQHATDGRMDGVQDQGQFHLVLADDPAERIGEALHGQVLSISRCTVSTMEACDRSKSP
jgi:hypothetical protein